MMPKGQVIGGRHDGATIPRRGRFNLPRPPLGRLAAILVPALLLAAVILAREQPPTVERSYAFVPSADTYVSSALPDENFGAQPVVRVLDSERKQLRAFLRFELRGVSGRVLEARLSLYPLVGSEAGVVVSEVSAGSWDERTTTFDWSPGVGPYLGHTGPVRSQRWARVDVTRAVKRDGPLMLALTALHPPSSAFASRETAMAPQLEVRVRTPAGDPPPERPAPARAAGSPAGAGDPVVVAAGNIACDPIEKPADPNLKRSKVICQAKATAELAAALRPAAVLALGDLQYDDGRLEKFRTSYALTWGRMRHLTHPVPGHREYLDTDGRPAAGYFSYFGKLGGDEHEHRDQPQRHRYPDKRWPARYQAEQEGEGAQEQGTRHLGEPEA